MRALSLTTLLLAACPEPPPPPKPPTPAPKPEAKPAPEPTKPPAPKPLPAPPAAPEAPAPAAAALSAGPERFADSFDAPTLDKAAWIDVRQGDFKATKTDILDVGAPGKPDRRLRLATNTIGTDDRTVKYLGVRTAHAYDFSKGRRFAVDIDWNAQRNGAYLTAALYLVPTAAAGDPAEAKDWLRWEFLGVPQDNGVRGSVTARRKGHMRWLERFGWPTVRKGRTVKNHRIEVLIDAQSLVIREQGEEVYRSDKHGLTFTSAAMYLVMSSHSNYFERAILFDDVLIEPAKVPKGRR